jgi:hypothetical protein
MTDVFGLTVAVVHFGGCAAVADPVIVVIESGLSRYHAGAQPSGTERSSALSRPVRQKAL